MLGHPPLPRSRGRRCRARAQTDPLLDQEDPEEDDDRADRLIPRQGLAQYRDAPDHAHHARDGGAGRSPSRTPPGPRVLVPDVGPARAAALQPHDTAAPPRTPPPPVAAPPRP